MSKIYTEDQLNELCKEYQKLLRIQDWNISVALVDTFDDPELRARVESQFTLMNAEIQICKSVEDMPQSLIHELMHIAFDTLCPEEALMKEMYERGIERVSSALSSLLSHKVSVLDRTIKSFECHDCGRLTNSEFVLEITNRDGSKTFRCMNCAAKFDKEARKAVQKDEQDEHYCYRCCVHVFQDNIGLTLDEGHLCINCVTDVDHEQHNKQSTAIVQDEQDELRGRHECYVCGVEQSFKSFKSVDPMNSANNRCWGCVDKQDEIDLPSAENSE